MIKAKTEIEMNKLIKRYCSDSSFYGFIDGIGWYVRKGDLKRMVSAFDDVFTFHLDEIERFVGTIKHELGRGKK